MSGSLSGIDYEYPNEPGISMIKTTSRQLDENRKRFARSPKEFYQHSYQIVSAAKGNFHTHRVLEVFLGKRRLNINLRRRIISCHFSFNDKVER